MKEIATYGWDVVYATNYKIINKYIDKNKHYPQKFSASKKIITSLFKISGEWTNWSLKKGGTGKNILIECIVSSGGLYDEKDTLIGSLEGSSITIQITLQKKIDTSKTIEDPSSLNNGVPWILQVNDKSIDMSNAVIIVESHYTNIVEGMKEVLDLLFLSYFNENIKEFDYIFSIVMLDLDSINEDLQWIKPTAFSYAVAHTKSDESSDIFSCLNLIDSNKNIGDRQQSIDNRISHFFTNNVDALVIFSKEIYTKYFLLPAAVNFISGSKEDDFEISEYGLSVYNKKELIWGEFVIGSKTENEVIKPLIPANGLNINLQQDRIHININGATFRPKKGHVTSTININQSLTFEMVRNDKNELIFIPDLKNINDININITNKVDKGIIITDIILGVITIMASLVYGVAAWRDISLIAKIGQETETGYELISLSRTFAGVEEAELAEMMWDTVDIGTNPVYRPTSIPIKNSLSVAQSISSTFVEGEVSSANLVRAAFSELYDDLESLNSFASNYTGTSALSGLKASEVQTAQFADSLVIGISLDDTLK
ncbi:TULIP family P47-like protein [Proteus sp. fly-1089]|uniref:TULIP family P47-like protein n=1 Tax=Proteus sp. fly-1089 TaxID=3136675 RepID=UPI0032DBC1BB